ncbi:MAG: 2-oxoacid:acceptor oxidoreductase family protein [Planctomycetota bacterium]|jgi:pyruvate ferredoxin oxidoreductase gamma subunit
MGKQDMMEIRWHGRGGQGAKTAATLVASVAVHEGKFAQGFPEYGPERAGAPIRGYTRISSGNIYQHSPIDHPNVVVVLDDTLLEIANVTDGLGKEGILIVNCDQSPAAIRDRVKFRDGKVYCIDATKIAIDTIGRPIPNTPMMAALAHITGAVTRQGIEESLREKLGHKFGTKIVEGNITAVARAFDETHGE